MSNSLRYIIKSPWQPPALIIILCFIYWQAYQLSYSSTYCLSAKALSECTLVDRVKQLVASIRGSGLSDTELVDQVLLAAIKAYPADGSAVKNTDSLIKLMNNNKQKVSNVRIYVLVQCSFV